MPAERPTVVAGTDATHARCLDYVTRGGTTYIIQYSSETKDNLSQENL